MAKIIRIITYEGSAEYLKKQLSRSLPDGEQGFLLKNNSITIATIECPENLQSFLGIFREDVEEIK